MLTSEDTQTEAIELDRSVPPARYAVVEGHGPARRVLCLMDDSADADALALELRRKGIIASACRTVTRR